MSSIAPMNANPTAPAAPVRTPKTALDQGDFLTLMIAQLKSQDPTKPVDNLQYVQQMAMFSQLAAANQTNEALAGISDRLDQLVTRFPSTEQ
ncbi:flagellar hook capping FlgD N-terminal domain-containing protein [Sandarakinorhabdus sp.]|uniref:flagellar hook assembly protein FlgD n=1 Tax=Sandarakinorhabdus sp. TaxID=1916663 RepID=UPI0033414A38